MAVIKCPNKIAAVVARFFSEWFEEAPWCKKRSEQFYKAIKCTTLRLCRIVFNVSRCSDIQYCKEIALLEDWRFEQAQHLLTIWALLHLPIPLLWNREQLYISSVALVVASTKSKLNICNMLTLEFSQITISCAYAQLNIGAATLSDVNTWLPVDIWEADVWNEAFLNAAYYSGQWTKSERDIS